MGSDPIALPFLESLREAVPEIELVGVFTQPDRPKGRGQKLHANEIKEWALRQELRVRQPERCGAVDEAWLVENEVTLILVMAYGQILKPGLLSLPPLGVYNLHASLLPKLRGASPIHTAIASGEIRTGVSLMRIIPPLDAGPFCDQEVVGITPQTTSASLIDALAQASVALIRRALPRVLDDRALWQIQRADDVTFCRRIFKEDAQLDFQATAITLDRRIRAFQPWPGTVFDYRGTLLKIGSVEVVERGGHPPGTLHCENETVYITCGKGSLRLLTLQRPGGKMLPTKDFLHGFPLQNGVRLTSKPMAPLVSRRPFPWKWRPGG